MHFSADANSANYGEVCSPSTQQLVERSNHTPPWGCAEMAESLQLSVRPLGDHGSQNFADSAPMEPSSSFAQWQIEEDRKFYAMFPEARPGSEWSFQSAPSKFFEGRESQHGSEAGTWVHASQLVTQVNATVSCVEDINSTDQSPLLLNHDTPSSRTLHYGHIGTPDYNQFPTSSSGHTSLPFPPTAPLQHDCATRRSGHNSTPLLSESTYLPQRVPTPHNGFVENKHVVPSHQCHHVVPSQQRPTLQRVTIPRQESEPPLMDHLPSPTSSHSSLSPHAEPHINQGYSPGPYYPTEPPTYWSMYPQQQISGLDPHFRHPVHTFVTSIRPSGWQFRPPSPRIRLSPLPSKRVLEKKPPLACLFCRGRKIACGPPEPGTTEKTCNQCQRRSIKCEYPSESRRGMRTKKTIGNKVNAAGPKVKLGKGPKLKR